MKKLLLILTVAISITFTKIECQPYKSLIEYNEREQYVYNTCKNAIFDQDEITKTELYKNADETAKQKMLLDHFNYQKRSYFILFESLLKEIILPILLFILVCKLFTPNLAIIGAILGFLAATGIGVGFTGLYNEARYLTSYYIDYNFYTIAKSDLDRLEEVYVQRKPWMNKELTKLIEDKIINIKSNTKLKEDFKTKEIAWLDIAINLPYKNKKTFPSSEKMINICLGEKNTGQEIRDKLEKYIKKYKQYSMRDSNINNILYFYGPSGIGKKTAVEKIAKNLDIPYSLINLKEDLTDLIGTKELPGNFLEILSKKNKNGYKNMFIIIDCTATSLSTSKINELLTKFIINYLELDNTSGKHTFKSIYLNNIKIDIGNVEIVILGSNKISDNRLLKIVEPYMLEFPTCSLKEKKEICWAEMFPEIIKNKNLRLKEQISPTNFTESDKKNIESFIINDADPGLLKLKTHIEEYYDDKFLEEKNI